MDTTSLLKWCSVNSVYIDPRLQVRSQHEGQEIGVFSLSSIPQDTTLVKILKDSVLSVKTCCLSEHIKFVPYGVGAQLSLSLALYSEILKQDRSNWYGYLQCLPTALVDLPVFWLTKATAINRIDADDCEEAISWLTRTEAAKTLQSKTDNHCSLLARSMCWMEFFVKNIFGFLLQDEITQFFFDTAQPLLLRHLSIGNPKNLTQYPTLAGFYRAFSLVSSRAFLVDSYHGLSMVPIADAFNHAVDNHVHLESDFHVCPECGSVKECTHDTGDLPSETTGRIVTDGDHDRESHYEMVSNLMIPPNSEVFNTYGEKLTNAQLLTQYGFILDLNENDRLFWTVPEVLSSCLPYSDLQGEIEPHIRQMCTLAMDTLSRCTNFLDQSELVYGEVHDLSLNDEGKISAQLWILLFAASLRLTRRFGDSQVEGLISRISGLELALESCMETEDSDDGVVMTVDQDLGADPVACQILVRMAESMVNLCETRERSSGRPGSSGQNLSDFLEELPESQARTRLAISLLLSERSILDACKSGWLTLMSRMRV